MTYEHNIGVIPEKSRAGSFAVRKRHPSYHDESKYFISPPFSFICCRRCG